MHKLPSLEPKIPSRCLGKILVSIDLEKKDDGTTKASRFWGMEVKFKGNKGAGGEENKGVLG